MKEEAVVIEFPLRGEWQTPTTPAKKVPSHGTNRMGLRYAFDFLQIDWLGKRRPFHGVSIVRYLLFGAPLQAYYCWGQEVFAPCDGEIIAIVEGISEQKRVHWLVVLVIGVKNAVTFDEGKDKFSQIAGNYIVMKFSEGVYAVFAHLQTGSINVSVAEKIQKGALLGRVGHSGNSTSPHLHFQLMDRSDLANAKGTPCLFETYEVYRSGVWERVYKQLPSENERIRFCKG